MILKEIPGAIYVDALPTGEFACCLFDGSVDTHIGKLTARDNLLPYYVRVTNIGGFQFAGQSSGNKQTLYYNGIWNYLDEIPVGINPVIFDHDGLLHISNGSVGSQGYRYVDYYSGKIVSGDDSLYLPAGDIFEYTYLGDGLYVGQGSVTGVVVWDGKFRRLLYDGTSNAIRASRFMELVAVSFYQPNKPSVIIQTTMQELRNLPIINPIPPVHETRNLYVYQTLVGTK